VNRGLSDGDFDIEDYKFVVVATALGANNSGQVRVLGAPLCLMFLASVCKVFSASVFTACVFFLSSAGYHIFAKCYQLPVLG
jgi:hypothetical protein